MRHVSKNLTKHGAIHAPQTSWFSTSSFQTSSPEAEELIEYILSHKQKSELEEHKWLIFVIINNNGVRERKDEGDRLNYLVDVTEG